MTAGSGSRFAMAAVGQVGGTTVIEVVVTVSVIVGLAAEQCGSHTTTGGRTTGHSLKTHKWIYNFGIGTYASL